MHLFLSLLCSLCFVSLAHAGPPNPTPSDAGYNTAGGTEALVNNGNGTKNTAFGALAMRVNDYGNRNTAFGAGALYNTNAGNNTAIGFLSLGENGTGWYNTAVGYFALGNNHFGGRNIAIGSSAGARLVHGNNNIYIGHPGFPKENLVLRLGDVQTRAFIKGVAGNVLSGSTVVITPSGQLGVRAGGASTEKFLADVITSLDMQRKRIEALENRVRTLTEHAGGRHD